MANVLDINYEGKEYKLDIEEITVQQARTIKSSCGVTLMGLENGLAMADPDALRAMFWLMLCQSGEVQDIDRLDFKIVKFAQALDKAAGSAAETEEAPKAKAGVKASRA